MTIYRNVVTGRLRLTKPESMDGWEKVSADQLTKASERVFLAVEELRGEVKETESRLRKELDDVTKRNVQHPAGDSKPEPVSLLKIVRGLSLGEWKGADYERSILLDKRQLGTNVDSAGGYIVPSEYLPAQFIELLRANAIAYQLPVTQLNGLSSSPIEFPQQTGAATAYWTAENAAITASAQTFGKKQMEPHGLKALTKMSNRILRMSDPSVERIVEEDIAAVLGIELSRAFFYGTSGSGEPLGVRHTSGITTTAMSATIAPDKLWDMIYQSEANNVPIDGSAAFAMNPREWNTLRASTTVIAAGVPKQTSGVYPVITKDIGGIPIHVSTQITASDVFFGVWRHAIIGRWGGIEFMASPHADTAFAADQTWIRATLDVDFLFRQPKAFVYDTSAQT